MVEVGLLLGTIRVAHDISAEQLAYGICDLSTLTKFEMGKRNVEKLLFDALYQRLGKYSGRFTTVLDNDEYDLIKKRWEIHRLIDEKQYDEARHIIEEYKKETTNGLHLQYLCLVECEIMHRTNADIELCKDKLLEGMLCTLPDFQIERIKEYYPARMDLFMEEQYARYMEMSGQTEEAVSIYNDILQIISDERYDRSERELHYRHVGFWLMEHYMVIEDYEKALEIGERTLEQIINGGFVRFLAEVRENIIICREHMGDDMSRDRGLLEILKRFNRKFSVGSAEDFFPRYTENRVYNVNDIIKQRRIMKGLTQSELAGEECSERTIIRIENHETTMINKTREYLLKRLNFPENKYISVVDTYDYKAFKVYNESRDMYDKGEFDRAEELLNELESNYKCNTINSRQYFFARHDDIHIAKTGKFKSSFRDMKDMLSKTLGNIDEQDISGVMLLENEWAILQNIVNIYKFQGDYEECTKYLQPIVETHNDKTINNNPNIYMFVKRKMGDVLGEMGLVDKANEHAIEGLKACCKEEFLPFIFTMTYMYAWNILEMKNNISDEERDICIEMLEFAYIVTDIYNDKYQKELIYSECQRNKIELNVINL